MTRSLWLEKLKLTYPKEVLDIVLFGSAIFDFDDANDLDVAVVFEKIPLKEQLDYAQKIKGQLKEKFDKEIHVSSFDYYSFFDGGNFARSGILFYGKSLISGKDFAGRFGLVPRLRINYDLRDLEKKDKVRFNYLLNGRGGNYGLIKRYGGKIVSPGVVEVLPEYEKVFIERMKKITGKVGAVKSFEIV